MYIEDSAEDVGRNSEFHATRHASDNYVILCYVQSSVFEFVKALQLGN